MNVSKQSVHIADQHVKMIDELFMKLPPLTSLRSFEAVARVQSVTRAAEELCVSHSAVSHQIRKLEEWLGLPLLERSGRGIRLTEAGERYKTKVCEAFEIIHAEAALLRQRNATPLVHVSCLPMFAVAWLMPQMHDFWGKFPDVQVAIQYARAATALDPASVDVAIEHGDPSDFPDFVAVPLLDGTTVPVASPDYLQRNNYQDPADLERLNLLHDEDRRFWRLWLEKISSDYGVSPHLAEQGGMIFPDGNLTLAACLAGEGVALLPRSVVLSQLRAKALVSLSTVAIQEEKSYLLLTPKNRPVSRSALSFAPWIQSLSGTTKIGVPVARG
jgi:LysR family glycine cleavage system transcriptional activator